MPAYYQAPEEYVRDFVNIFIEELQKSGRLQGHPFREARAVGISYQADFGLVNIVIEAEPPGRLKQGEDQVKEYMKSFGYEFGIVIDIPTRRYYEEVPKPYTGKVGFEVYKRTPAGPTLIFRRLYERREIEDVAAPEFRAVLDSLTRIEVARLSPANVNLVLDGVRFLRDKYHDTLKGVLASEQGAQRLSIYESAWKRNMELTYGEEAVRSAPGDLRDLFVDLTIYVAFLKVLGSTLLESIMGGGYRIPFYLSKGGSGEAVRLFWERRALERFDVGYLFERDEFDWVFDPSVAGRLDSFYRDLGQLLLRFDWSQPVEADFLKRIYQHVVPREVRRALGEFYTPDWIAELMLYRALHVLARGAPPRDPLPSDVDREVADLLDEYYGKHGRIPRFVDPTCGSFTFGVHYLGALARWYSDRRPRGVSLRDLVGQILEGVVGIDINPIAVITAKVNYLLGLHSLIAGAGKEESIDEQIIIPIIRADLTVLHDLSSTKAKVTLESFIAFSKDSAIVKIPLALLGVADESVLEKLSRCRLSVETLTVREESGNEGRQLIERAVLLKAPRSVLESGSFAKLHRGLVALLSNGVEGLKNELGELGEKLSANDEELLNELVGSIRCLESQQLDNYWHTILMSGFLLAYIAKRGFDLVLGNLPWVNVSKYPQAYRARLTRIMRELGVAPPREAARKADVSVILFAIAAKYLLADGGVIALMVPASLFRGLHGASWRDFSSMGLELIEAWDLEEVRPFEGAENQPGIVLARRGRA